MENINLDFEEIIINSKNILFIQDIDGVCIPLVKDPMTRKLESKFIFAVKNLEKEFYVLTCGEHEGPRGVNRIVERSLRGIDQPKEKGLYLRGLAACGVEYQDMLLRLKRCPNDVGEFINWCEKFSLGQGGLEGLKSLIYWPKIYREFNIKNNNCSMINLIYLCFNAKAEEKKYIYEVLINSDAI
ncbi:hypothetical protein OA981_03170, partial [Prochlorococcus sp. AH-716-A09]|nr:hypothetical protein [Prochlorococcus sp. AH-716-A09]